MISNLERSMKVLMIDRCCADSIWTVVSPVSEMLVSEGHQVCWVRMVAPGWGNRAIAPPGVEVMDLRVPKDAFPCAWMWQMLFFGPQFRRILKDWRPDVVHTHFAVPGIVARWLGKKAGCRVISTQHELLQSMNGLLRAGTRWSERYVDVITYVSRTVAASYGEPDAPVLDADLVAVPNRAVVYNSIDFDRMKKVCESAPPRQSHKLVCVGRMVPEKGQGILIEAMPQILRAHPGAELHFCGSGPEEEALKQCVEQLGLTNQVTFHGWLEKQVVLDHMATAHCVLQPSHHEGFGLTVVEGIACGAEVIASDIPVFREVAGDLGDAVKFAPPREVAVWASMTIQLLDRASPTAVELSDIERRFSDSVNAACYLVIYQKTNQKP